MKITRHVWIGGRVGILVAAGSVVLLTGCYKRTISTSGVGSYGANVQESNRSNTAADRWVDNLFAEPKTTRKTRWVESAR